MIMTLDDIASDAACSLKRTSRISDPWFQAFFEAITDAYKRITGVDLADTDKKAAAKEVYAWYFDTYQRAGLQPGSRGSKKNVNQFTTIESYKFDTLYAESVFDGCMLDGKRPGSECILHFAVALQLTPEECDDLLRDYGYLPLHVKNIHHLAIYAVLRENRGINHNAVRNHFCFAQLREMFEDAGKLVSECQTIESVEADEEIAFQSNDTNMIRKHLFEQDRLDTGNYLAYISKHKDVFNYLHSAIRAEYLRLIDVFQTLYDTNGKLMCWDGSEGNYSLFQFLCNYCGDYDRKHFNENLRTIIEKKGRHPTREIMILLWLYEYCFLEAEPVYITEEYRKTIKQRSVSICVDYDTLDVGRYLTGEEPEACTHWDFSDLKTHINAKLQDFGWQPLSQNSVFDSVILILSRFAVDTVKNHIDLYYTDARTHVESAVEDKLHVVANVPAPLSAVFAILCKIRDAVGGYVLETAVYEQL